MRITRSYILDSILMPTATLCYPMRASLIAQLVKNLPAVQETRVQSLRQEDALEKGMAITPVFLPGESHGQGSLAGYSPWGHKSQT